MKTYGNSIQLNQLKDISRIVSIRPATTSDIRKAEKKLIKADKVMEFYKIKTY